MNVRPSIVLFAMLLSAAAAAEFESRLRDAGSLGAIRLAGTEEPAASKTYIVQLRAPSAVEHYSSLRAVSGKPGRPQIARPRFDKTDPAIQGYAARLVEGQDKLLALSGAQLIYRYQFGLNGFAARMHPSQAHKLENLPEVLHVWEDEVRPLATTDSPRFLKLFDRDKGLRGPLGLDGEDIIIGVIDSGVRPEHPSLSDMREANIPRLCRGDWAENSLLGKWLCRRFKDLPDELMFEPPEAWNGICQSGERFEETLCNNKLIGARFFADGAQSSGPIDPGEILSPRDVDGHGTHTATTAAGNATRAEIFDTVVGRVEGIAPRARVAAYKACWLRPGEVRASCNTSDLVNAIDAAVADGVDIINYSVGNSLTRVTTPDDIALLAATKAGVFTVVAAGNEGPNLGTVGSPAGGPWIITAAASTRDGTASFEALRVSSPPSVAGLVAMKEANFTPSLEEIGTVSGDLVLVDDDSTDANSGVGTTSDGCQSIENGSEVAGQVALVQRGGCLFTTKILNAEDAGAEAVVVYNLAGDPIVMNGSSAGIDIPAVMIGQADANLLLAEVDAGNQVVVQLEHGLLLKENDDGNVMASFSARGPGPAPDIVKPDVTAPGVNIVAGFTPDAVNSTPGEDYAYLSGTSMSTPHVAGVAALLKQAHPEWSPTAIKSALMTTARQDLIASDGESAAHPFDYGAGHIVPNDASDPGLVYEVNDDEYDAFGCGTEPRLVADSRCDDLEAAGFSFAGADLNQPSIGIARMASGQTVRRHVTSVSEQTESFVAEVTPPIGMNVDVAPPSITVGPGETVSYDVTFNLEDGPLDLWRFGALNWVGEDHSVYSSIAVKPISITAPAQVTETGGSGSLAFPVEFGYTGAYTPRVHGLRLPAIINGFVDNDPTKTFTFRTDNGVTAHLIDVPVNQLYLRFSLFNSLTDGDDDLDMYVYFCPDNVNCNKIGESGEFDSDEEFNVFRPAAGRYAVLIHGFETDESNGPGSNYQLLGWAFGIDDDQGNMTVSGPAFVNAGTTDTVTVNWSGLATNTIYLGGVSHNTPEGLAALTIIRIGN